MNARTVCALLLLVFAGGAQAGGDDVPVSAGDVLELAKSSAANWAEDSVLIYLENDESVDAAGHASRWGYLFYSPSRDRWRAYSLSQNELESAGDLDFAFKAPPVSGGWLDSERAFAIGEDAGGREYREKRSGRLRTMLLMRGAFGDDPNLTTWTLVYDAPGTPSLFVVLDAIDGDIVRVWKG